MRVLVSAIVLSGLLAVGVHTPSAYAGTCNAPARVEECGSACTSWSDCLKCCIVAKGHPSVCRLQCADFLKQARPIRPTRAPRPTRPGPIRATPTATPGPVDPSGMSATCRASLGLCRLLGNVCVFYGGLVVWASGCSVGALVAALDYDCVGFFDCRYCCRFSLGLLRIGVGRLVVLGCC